MRRHVELSRELVTVPRHVPPGRAASGVVVMNCLLELFISPRALLNERAKVGPDALSG